MNKLIDKFNIYVLYTALFVVLSIFVFFSFIISGNFIVILEIFCAGLAFIAYSTYNKKSRFATAIGAIIYSFSGFMLYAAVKNPVAAISTITLPLMLLGIDRVLKKDDFLIFIIASIFSGIPIIWSVYPVCLTAFFSLLYTFIKYFNEYKGKRKFCIKFTKLLFFYAIAIGLTSLVLTSSINIFRDVYISPDFGFVFQDFDYYMKTLYMNSATTFWCKAYILPIVLTMLPIAALNFKKNKENRTWIIYFLLLGLFYIVPCFSYILNGFAFEPNKWGFIFSFVLAYIVTVNIRNDLIYSPREFKFVKKMLILYLVVWFIFRSHTGNFALLSIVFAFIYLIILLSRSLDYKELKENQQFEYSKSLKTPEANAIKNRIKLVLIFALCANISFFAWHLFIKLNYSKELTKAYYSVGTNYTKLNYTFSGKNKNKILIDNNQFQFTKKNNSINMVINDSIKDGSKLYLVVHNLKFSKNNQYTITAKYDDLNTKYTIRDFVKTPSYIVVPDAVLYLGKYLKGNDTIKLSLSSGTYSYDSIMLVSTEH